jgi:hypothetical protein
VDVAGYISVYGADGGSGTDDVWKFTFASETWATLSNVLVGGYQHFAGAGTGVSDASGFGWLGGMNRGNCPNPEKVAFASDTFSAVSWQHDHSTMYNNGSWANGWL